MIHIATIKYIMQSSNEHPLLSLILEGQTLNEYTNGLFSKLPRRSVEQIDTNNSLGRLTISSLSVLLSNQSGSYF